MIRDNISLAIKNLSQRRLRSWLTMIGIFIGIAAVVSLIGLGEGLRVAITSQFGFLGTDILSVQASGLNYAGPPGSAVVDPLKDTLVEKIAKVSGVKAAFGRRIGSGILEFNDIQDITYVATIPMGENRKTFEKMTNLQTDQGRLLRDSDSKKVVLGADYTTEDRFGKGIISGDRLFISGKQFEVAGILKKKGSFVFDSIVMFNEDDYKDLFGDKGSYDVIAIQVKDQNEISNVQQSVEKLLRKERGVKVGEENFEVQTPQNAIKTLNDTLFAVQIFVYIIAAISLVVGGIGIMNTMYTSVLERTKEIGIMKAIGARNSIIFQLFFIESGFLGLVGGIIGIIIGVSLATGLAFVGKTFLGSELIKAEISFTLIFGALMFSFVLGTLFGVLPAIQASKLQPVDALRK